METNIIENRTHLDNAAFLDYLLRLKRVQEKHINGYSAVSKKRQAKINETRSANAWRKLDNDGVLTRINNTIREHEKAAKQ